MNGHAPPCSCRAWPRCGRNGAVTRSNGPNGSSESFSASRLPAASWWLTRACLLADLLTRGNPQRFWDVAVRREHLDVLLRQPMQELQGHADGRLRVAHE